MTRKLNLLAVAAALVLATGAMPAMAQQQAPAPAPEQTSTVRGFRAGDFLIGASVIGVLPTNGGSVDIIGGSPHANNAWTGQLDFTYFVNSNFSLNLIAATTRHDLEAQNTVLGNVALGRVWALPPTLTVQYHPIPMSRFSPYVGLGLNYTIFYGEGGTRNPAVTNVDVRNAPGVALNAGLNVEVAPNWVLNFDVKYLYLRPQAHVDTVIGRINATANLDPWVVGAGIRYRF